MLTLWLPLLMRYHRRFDSHRVCSILKPRYPSTRFTVQRIIRANRMPAHGSWFETSVYGSRFVPNVFFAFRITPDHSHTYCNKYFWFRHISSTRNKGLNKYLINCLVNMLVYQLWLSHYTYMNGSLLLHLYQQHESNGLNQQQTNDVNKNNGWEFHKKLFRLSWIIYMY